MFPRIRAHCIMRKPSLARCVFRNRDGTAANHVCEAFFQKLPEQDVKNNFMLLLPGRPLVAQGKLWTRCPVEGLGRLRNLATATLLASFKELTDQDQESFRVADKESISLFFSNGSIVLVAISEDQVRVSAKLKHLPWLKSPFKIVAAKFYQVEHGGEACPCPVQGCTHQHACCGSSVLCLKVAESESSAAKLGDSTNFQKALEDDVAKRVLREIFNDRSFVANSSVRCVRPKLS
jgi:hypothetical protein